jgi:hypothetical protein
VYRPLGAESQDGRSAVDPAVREVLDYLDECLADYEKFVSNIGKLGLAAPMLLYYRDEVQDCLEDLKEEREIDLKDRWKKVSELDNVVRVRAREVVNEVGHRNFKQYRIINDPPKIFWWWYLDQVTEPPPETPRAWEFWKK